MEGTRVFTDREGVRWSVTEVAPQQDASPMRDRRKFERMAKRPAAKDAVLETRDLKLPWLRFESRGDCRTIEPAPEGWRTLSDSLLEDLLGRSTRLRGR